MSRKHFGQLIFKHFGGWRLHHRLYCLSSADTNKKQESALGTWRLVEMLGASQVHRWTGIDQTYQTPDLDTRGYVSENGLDADAKHSKTSACGLFLKSDSQEGTTGNMDMMARAQCRHRAFWGHSGRCHARSHATCGLFARGCLFVVVVIVFSLRSPWSCITCSYIIYYRTTFAF